MYDINCPYCDAEQDINHDEGQGYDQDILHQQQCSECHKTYTFYTYTHFSYDPQKADCLNGGTHDWKEMHIYPNFYKVARYCSSCGEEEKEICPVKKDKYFSELKEKLHERDIGASR
jgi:uncharacterized protein (DUF983 family)